MTMRRWRSRLPRPCSTAGYAVRTAGNGLDALLAVEALDPPLVILDLHMPIMDGWEFAEELGSLGLRPRLLIITRQSPGAETAAKQVEADDFLRKPFDLNELLDKVDHLRAA
jgi:DNA-binding response OmpR family regulator